MCVCVCVCVSVCPVTYCLTHYYIWLTYSMLQSPSWEANWFAASQEIPQISRNPKVHYRTHKRQPPVSILNQPNPVHIPTSHLLEIRPNIMHPSTPRSPQWSPSSKSLLKMGLLVIRETQKSLSTYSGGKAPLPHWRLKQQVPPKSPYFPTQIHGVTNQNTLFLELHIKVHPIAGHVGPEVQ